MYLVKEKFYEDRPDVILINPPVNSAGGIESSRIREDKVGPSIIELVPVSGNYNFGPADIEVVAGTEYVGNVFYNVAYEYVLEGELQDYSHDQQWSWVWTRGGAPDKKKVRRRIEDALRKGSDSQLFAIAKKVGVKTAD